MAIPVDTFFLDPEAPGTLQARIQQMIAAGILSGRMRKGEKLPSTRRLAQHLGVSRITVSLAYSELVAGDYLRAVGRSGYYISDTAPVPDIFEPARRSADAVDWTRAIGQRFSTGPEYWKPRNWSDYRFPFIYGQADPTLFDHANWRLCVMQALGQRDFAALSADQYDEDDPLLVEFIARQILPRRGIVAHPEEILVTLGAQNALWIAAQVLLTQRRGAAVEDPCYPALRDILAQTRCHMMPIATDVDGMPPALIPDSTDLIFVTPSHQCPTNATMPLDRRRALLERARQIDALIVEDDYEFEMSFLKAPLPSLKSLDRDGRVIYAGSFSKSLFPGLRLGFLMGSAPFIREARALRASVLRHPPGHLQRSAAYFLSLGHYDTLVTRMARAFHRRREVMEEAISKAGLTIAGRGAFGGSSLWMEAPEGVNTVSLAEVLKRHDVLIEPGQPFFGDTAEPSRHYRLAYSSIPHDRISEGIHRIGDVLESDRAIWT